MITGAAKRVGRAIALGLVREGARIILHYHTSEAEAQETASMIEALGGEFCLLKQDLRDPDGVASLIARAADIMGPIDGLVNCASVFRKGSGYDLLEEHLAVHVTAPYILSREFAAFFRKTHESDATGCIINMIDSRIGNPAAGFSPYYISKGALSTMTSSLAVDLAPQIRVNGIAPGAILPKDGRDEAYFRRMSETLPVGRTGSTDDLVRAVSFLITSEFVTGEVLRVDGGGHLL